MKHLKDLLEPNVAQLYFINAEKREMPMTITLEQQIALSTAISFRRIADALEKQAGAPKPSVWDQMFGAHR